MSTDLPGGQPPAPQGQGPHVQTPIPTAHSPHRSDNPRRCSPNIPPAPPAPFGGAPRALPPQAPFSFLSPQILGWGRGPGLPDPAAEPGHGISTALPHVSEPAGLSLAGRGFRGRPLIALLSSAIWKHFCPLRRLRLPPQRPWGLTQPRGHPKVILGGWNWAIFKVPSSPRTPRGDLGSEPSSRSPRPG